MLTICSAPLQVRLHPVKSTVRRLVEYFTLWQITEIQKYVFTSRHTPIRKKNFSPLGIWKQSNKYTYSLSPCQRLGSAPVTDFPKKCFLPNPETENIGMGHSSHFKFYLTSFNSVLMYPFPTCFTCVKVMRSLSLSKRPFSCRVLRLGEIVKHSLSALHNFKVMSLEQMAGDFLLKWALGYILSEIGGNVTHVNTQTRQVIQISLRTLIYWWS